MRLNQIDLNLFIVFDAVYQQRNLTRAAEVLCITQPAVSNALGRLREKLNDSLFVRTSEGMTPTPLAENIVGRVQEALLLLNASASEGVVFDPAQADKVFRISMNDMLEAMVLPELLECLQSVAPNVAIECYYVPRDELKKELTAGTLDFAIDIPVITDAQICQKPLLAQPYVCVVRKDHPFIGDSISLDEYLSLEHIHVSSRRKGPGYEDVALNRLGHQRRVKIRVQHYHLSSLLVARTDMALTVPLSMAQKYDHKILDLPYSIEPLNMSLYWHKSSDLDKANVWMRNLFSEKLN